MVDLERIPDELSAAGVGAELALRAEPLDDRAPHVLVASLDDVIRLNEEAGRPKDLAVLPLLRAVRAEVESG